MVISHTEWNAGIYILYVYTADAYCVLLQAAVGTPPYVSNHPTFDLSVLATDAAAQAGEITSLALAFAKQQTRLPVKVWIIST